MKLPLAHVPTVVDATTLLRYYHQLDARWSEQIADSSAMEVGVAFVNGQLARVRLANRVLDGALPAGVSPADAFDLVERHYAEQNLICHQWVMNPSAPAERTRPMEQYLLDRGWLLETSVVMRLQRLPAAEPPPTLDGLQVIPARAGFRQARELADMKARDWAEPQLADAGMLHLDDPHYDAMMALHGGRAVAFAGLLTMGELGLIEQVHVVADLRRRGLGTLIVRSVLEIAARGLLKHVLIGIGEGNSVAIALHGKLGFQVVGRHVAYQRPANTEQI